MTADKTAIVLDAMDPLHAASLEFTESSCTFGLGCFRSYVELIQLYGSTGTR